MITFHIRSLKFNPSINTTKVFAVKIELSGGSQRTTEPSTYDPDHNIAVISETIEFFPIDPRKNIHFTLTVIEKLNNSLGKAVFQTLRPFDQTLENDKFQINSMTPSYGEIQISFSVICSHEVTNMWRQTGSLTTSKTASFNLRPIEVKHDDDDTARQDKNYNDTDPVLQNLANSLTPLIDILFKGYEILEWKNPSKTFVWAVIGTFILLNAKGFILVTSLFTLFFGHIILSMIFDPRNKIKAKYTPEIYQRNVELIKEFMKYTTKLFESWFNFTSNDKFKLTEMTLLMRKLALLIIVTFLIFDTSYGLLFTFWIQLFSKTPIGKKVTQISGPLFDQLILTLDQKINQGFTTKKTKKSKVDNPTFINEDIKSLVMPSSIRAQIIQENKRVYVTYENQRWWNDIGFSHSTFPGERSAWSDEEGKFNTPKESFQLPNNEWKWLDDWHVITTFNTDDNGWEYASNFTNAFHSNKGVFDFVRRRKWIRNAIRSQAQQESNDEFYDPI